MLKVLSTIIFCTVVLLAPTQAQTIQNSHFRVDLDAQQRHLTITEKTTGIVTAATLPEIDTIASCTSADIADPTFEAGRALTIHYASGELLQLTLYETIPFVAIQRMLVNKTAAVREVDKVEVLTAAFDLNCPLAQVRTHGSGGLSAPGKKIGSYVYLSTADGLSNRGVVTGWLTHERGSGVVLPAIEGERPSVQARIDYGQWLIPAGAAARSEILLLGCFNDVRDGLTAYADAIAADLKIRLPEQPVFYMTWYNGAASTEVRIAKNSDFVQQHLLPYGMTVMQIDDHWQSGVSHDGPKRDFSQADPKGPYPSGMKKTAEMLAAKNLIGGIWYIPFAGTWHDPYWADKQDLFLKQGNSPDNHFAKTLAALNMKTPYASEPETPFVAGWGGTCLDLTNPKSLQYVETTARRIAKDWGYQFFKMDGLWTGTGTRLQYVNNAYIDDNLGKPIRAVPEITAIQAFRNGLRTVRKGAGDDVFLLGCSQTQNMRSFGASIGLVDAMRVGPDNGGGRNMPDIVTAVSHAARYYFMDKRVWYTDPDSFSIRSQVALIPARTYLSWITLSGMLNSTSEDYATLPADRLALLQTTMPSHRLKTFRPVDFYEHDPARIWTLADNSTGTTRTSVGLFNWGSSDIDFTVPMTALGLDPQLQYVGFDYWNDAFVPPFSGTLAAAVAGEDCRILSLKPVADHPQVVGTSRHVTQGAVDLLAESWDAAEHRLSGKSRVVAGAAYQIRIALPWALATYLATTAEVDGGATITLANDGPTVRATIIAPQGGEIAWRIGFRNVTLPETAPAAIDHLVATATSESVQLTWQGTGSNVVEITRSTAAGERVFTGKNYGAYTDRSVEAGTTCTYAVATVNWAGRRSAAVTATAIIPARPVPPPLPPKPEISLTSRNWLSATAGWGAPRKGQAVTGKPLTLDGVVYTDGIGTHATSNIVYAVPPGAKRFVAVVGIDDSVRGRPEGGTIRFIVRTDVKEFGETPVTVAESPLLSERTCYSWSFNIELDPRVREIQLLANESPDGINSDHADWANAGFLK